MEIWDAYNSDFEIIDGMTLIRGEEASIPRGVYHLVCHVLVQHTDGSYLLMQRDPRKPYANMWEATAGGSALKGETPLVAARRELLEETGISSDDLEEICRYVWEPTHCVYVLYLCVTNCSKDSVQLQEGETVAYKWATAGEIRLHQNDVVPHSADAGPGNPIVAAVPQTAEEAIRSRHIEGADPALRQLHLQVADKTEPRPAAHVDHFSALPVCKSA